MTITHRPSFDHGTYEYCHKHRAALNHIRHCIPFRFQIHGFHLLEYIYTLWLFNIAMEAMVHLYMVYLLKMVIFHGYVK